MFSRCTLAFLFKKCTERTLPVGWDDPSISEDLNQLLVDVFNGAGRGTLKKKSVEIPKTIPLITINEDNLRSGLRFVSCMNHYELLMV